MIKEQELLLRQIMSNDFAIIDLHLYLDTHPDDKEISEKLEKYIKKCDKLKKEYQEKYGPLTNEELDGNNYKWIQDPWPWDNSVERECK